MGADLVHHGARWSRNRYETASKPLPSRCRSSLACTQPTSPGLKPVYSLQIGRGGQPGLRAGGPAGEYDAECSGLARPALNCGGVICGKGGMGAGSRFGAGAGGSASVGSVVGGQFFGLITVPLETAARTFGGTRVLQGGLI